MNKKLLVPSTIQKLTTLADSTFRLTVDCQELEPAEMALLFELKGKIGYFLFSENEIQESDIPTENAPEMEGKSLSQRERGVLFVYWKTRKDVGSMIDDFNTFYKKAMEKRIQEIKDKIDL